jgi:hypothetical protein
MSDSYVAAKIREAVAAAEGSRARAQRILLTWAQTDDRLLRGLAAPFMKAIVTGAVERATRPVRNGASGGQQQLSPEALDLVLAKLASREGGPPPARSASAGPTGGDTARGIVLGTLNPTPATKAGDRHVQTMKALAALYKRRRGD